MKSSLTRSKPDDSQTQDRSLSARASHPAQLIQKAFSQKQAIQTRDVLQLNSTLGNQSTARWLQQQVVQRKVYDSSDTIVEDDAKNLKELDALEILVFRYYANLKKTNIKLDQKIGHKNFQKDLQTKLQEKLLNPSDNLAQHISENMTPIELMQYAGNYSKLVQKVGTLLAQTYDKTSLHLPKVAEGTAQVRTPKQANTQDRKDGDFTYVDNTLPGKTSNTTSAPNLVLSKDSEKRGNRVQTAKGAHLQICMGCGEALPASHFDVDHQQAFAEIKSKLFELSVVFNAKDAIRDQFIKQIGQQNYKNYFLEVKNVTFPSNLAMRHYSADVDNLNHLCTSCNSRGGKGDVDFISWYRQNPLFGEDFLQAYQIDEKWVLARTQTGEGWGKVAREWFYNHHFEYLKQKLDMAKEVSEFEKMVDEQDSLFYQASFESDVKKKQDMQERGRQLSRTSGLYIKTVSELNQWQQTTKYPLRDKSPERIQNDFHKVLQDRDQRREEEEKAKQKTKKKSSVLGKRQSPLAPSQQPTTTSAPKNANANSSSKKKDKKAKILTPQDLKPLSYEIADWNQQDRYMTHGRLVSCKDASDADEFIELFVTQSLRSWATFMNGQNFDTYIQHQGRNWWSRLQNLLRKWYNSLGY